MGEKLTKNETFEHLGAELGDVTVGEIIIRSDEFGNRLDAQGEEGAQKALDLAVAPKVKVDTKVWKI